MHNFIDAEIIPPKEGDVIKVRPIVFLGLTEYIEHINRAEIVTCLSVSKPTFLSMGFWHSQDGVVHYCHFCKYCNV